MRGVTPDVHVLIVGAGPIGIELAVALKKAGVRYSHVDAGQIGSTISWYAPQTQFFSSPERISIAGVPLQTVDQSKATREEYLTYLRSVVLQFDLQIDTFVRVLSISRLGDGTFEVRTSPQLQWSTAITHIVLAMGDMHRPHLLGIPGETLPHVSHYFADPHLYFRRRVVVVGGRNSAIEAAIRCVRVGADVTLVHRLDELDGAHIKFWLMPEIRAMIRDRRMTFIGGATVRSVGEREVILDPDGRVVHAGAVLLLTGYEQDSTLFEQARVNLIGPQKRPQFDERTMETNVRGLFVAGTAAAGTQVSGTKAFIETSHIHVDRIVAALTGAPPPAEQAPFEMPES